MENLSLRIPLRISNQRAYVWDVDDVAELRSKHHITGLLSGTLPHLAQQNVFLGLPLILAPEEVVLLVSKGIAHLIHDPTAHLAPSTDQADAYTAARTADAAAQRAAAEARAIEEAHAHGRATSESATRKRAEREARRAAERAAQAAAAADESDSILAPDPDEGRDGTPAPTTTASSSAPAYTALVPASSSALEWYAPERATYATLDEAREAGVWTYPATADECARCAVFADLWEKGYFMGGGIKFGGDWLVYPGDPLRYHSHFVAQTLPEDHKLRPMEIVAHGRLGTATKKSHLLCAPKEDGGGVDYWSIEWAGFG